MTEIDERARAEDLERSLAGKVSWALPAATVVTSVGVGIAYGVGPAILVLAAGALVGVIGLLWASLRTLGGDAPLAEGLVAAASGRESLSHVGARKRRVLRALKDLELEHSVGKIDDEDYAEISGRYRDQAKAILREMDVEIEPLRSKAEALAVAHLKKVGLAKGKRAAKAPASPVVTEETAPASSLRLACARCETSNEPDAEFCKKCGARLARISCPSCSTSNEPDATFCKKCGTSLSGESLAEAKNA
jgi:ribosomal protein L40E